jgi:hypothetical protein
MFVLAHLQSCFSARAAMWDFSMLNGILRLIEPRFMVLNIALMRASVFVGLRRHPQDFEWPETIEPIMMIRSFPHEHLHSQRRLHLLACELTNRIAVHWLKTAPAKTGDRFAISP